MESMTTAGLTDDSSPSCNRTLSKIILVKIDLLFHHAVEGVRTISRCALGVHTRWVHHVLHRLLRLPEIHVATIGVIFMGPRSLGRLHGLVLGRFPEGRVARILSEIDAPLVEVTNSWHPDWYGVALSPTALEEGSFALALLMVPLLKHSMLRVMLLI